MSLFEIHLEKPAYKRIKGTETDESAGETIDTEIDAEGSDAAGSRRRPAIAAMAVLAVVAALAIKRRRA